MMMNGDGHIRAYIPTCESYGWTGGPVFRTRIVTRQNGLERRNADWSNPQHEFSLPFSALTQAQYAPIKRMHLNRRGAWGVFLYRDRLDDTAQEEVFSVAEPGQDTFQLTKSSAIAGVLYQRRIRALYLPDPSSAGDAMDAPLTIMVDGSVASDYMIDRDNGTVIFDSPLSGGQVLTWSGEFSNWVRFVSDKLPFTIINRGTDGYFVNGTIDLLEMLAPIPEMSSES